MKRVILANSVSSELSPLLDNRLQDFAQVTGRIDYNDIIALGEASDLNKRCKSLNTLFRKLNAICREMGLDYYEAAEEDDEAAEYVDKITELVKL